MSIFDFVKKLLPSMKRIDVEKDVSNTVKEMSTAVLPSWQAAAEYFKLNKLGSQEGERFTILFYRSYRPEDFHRKASNVVFDIAGLLKNVDANLRYVEGLVSHFETDILSGGLTVKNAFILRAAGHFSLISRFSLSLLNYLYTAEAKHYDVSLDPSLELSRGEIAYVEKNITFFSLLLVEYAKDPAKFKKHIDQLSELQVSEKLKTSVEARYHAINDPLEPLGIAGFVTNPIYALRMQIAQWQNSRYDAAKAKKRQLELRLLYLEMEQDKVKDANVEKEISHLQERIEKLDYYLHGVEESLEITP